MTEVKHTPTPWEVVVAPSGTPDITDNKGNIVAAIFGGSAEANDAHIVQCVNLHDELVEALREIASDTNDGKSEIVAREALKKAGAL